MASVPSRNASRCVFECVEPPARFAAQGPSLRQSHRAASSRFRPRGPVGTVPRSRLSLVILPFSGRADGRRRRYTTRTSDRRIVWRVLAEEFRYSCVKRAASSHFLPRSARRILAASLLFLFLEDPLSVGRNETVPGDRRRRVATTCCSWIRPTTAEMFRCARRGRTAECPCGGAGLSRIPKDDARASRGRSTRWFLENDWNLMRRGESSLRF